MGHTNSTPNIGLPQFIGTDKPTWLGDVNGAMSAIDTKIGSIDAAIATVDAKADNAVADASGAVTTATNAVNTAGAASTTATQANNLATQALTVANNTADLCTQSIVPSVTANTTAIGTLADLTTTAKDNLVNAINEVAQGGGGGSSTPIAKFTVTGDGTITNGQAVTQIGTYIASNPISEKAYIIGERSGVKAVYRLSDIQTNAFSGFFVGASNVTFDTLVTSTGNWREAYGSGSGISINATVDSTTFPAGDKLVLYDYQ